MSIRFPFAPEVLDSLPEELAELFRGLELTLLKEICSRLRLADQLNEVTVQDIRALRSHGIDLKDIEKAIRDVTGISQKKLDKLLDEVVERNQQYYTEMVTLAQVTMPQTLVDEADIDAIRKQCQREFGNITRSMGFLVDNGRTMLKPAQCYQHCLDSALLQVQSGAIDYNTAIRNAVRELADSGLMVPHNNEDNWVQYQSGHYDRVDVCVRRAVMTGVNQINAKYRERSMDYLETDLVEVSAHLGARNIPGLNGWEAHTEWQGKVFRWKRHGEQAQEPQDAPESTQLPPREHTSTAPQAPVQRRTEPLDVTEEYQRTATPEAGEITYDDGYEHGKNKNEIRAAKWLHERFGGDIRLLKVSETDSVKRPDYLWKNKLWELKNPSSIGAADKRLEHGLKQIRKNPGGVVIDMEKEVDMDELVNQITRRFLRNHDTYNLDIMILSKGDLVKVLRYKK